MSLRAALLILLIIVLVSGLNDFGPGPFYGAGYRYGGGTLGLILAVFVIILLLRRL